MPRLILLGGGGHARVLATALRDSQLSIQGYVAVEPAPDRDRNLLPPYLGDDNVVFDFDPGEVRLINGVGSARNAERRQRLYDSFRNHGYSYISVIHPSAQVAEGAGLGEAVQVMAGAVIQTGCVIGDNTIVNTSTIVDHDCMTGRHCHIAPGAILCGNVILGDNVHVGAGAVIKNGITVGGHAVIGLGAAVVTDVSAGTTVVGVPAREMKC